MGETSLPTAADYAWAEAENASRSAAENAKKLSEMTADRARNHNDLMILSSRLNAALARIELIEQDVARLKAGP